MSLFERELDALGDAPRVGAPDREAVDEEQHRVLLLLVELGLRIEVMRLAVDDHARESARGQVRENLAKLPLTMDHEGGQKKELGPARKLEKLASNVLRALRFHDFAANVAVLVPNFGVENTQVVVDFRDRPHGRARIAGRALLLDGYGRG